MAVRSRRLFPWTLLGSATVPLFTVPADRTLIVRSVFILNTAALGQAFTLDIDCVDGLRAPIDGQAVAAGAIYRPNYNDDVILNPGDVLIGSGPAVGSGLYAIGFGSLLLGAPA